MKIKCAVKCKIQPVTPRNKSRILILEINFFITKLQWKFWYRNYYYSKFSVRTRSSLHASLT